MLKLRAILIMTVYAILVTFASLWMAKQSYSWFPPEAAAEAKLQDDLFSLFTGLGTFIYLGVMGPFLYSLVFHRASKYDMSDGPDIEGNTWLEIVWTAVPLVLVFRSISIKMLVRIIPVFAIASADRFTIPPISNHY